MQEYNDKKYLSLVAFGNSIQQTFFQLLHFKALPGGAGGKFHTQRS